MPDNNDEQLPTLHHFMFNQIITDKHGKMVYNNPDAITEENRANVHYTFGTEMEELQFANLAEKLKIKNLRAVPSQQRQFTPGQQFTHLFEQMYRENAEKRSLQNIAFFSRPRSHIYGIQLKMNHKGYIVAKIADSLKPNYSEGSNARNEHDELLAAIKDHNKKVWNERGMIQDVAQRRNAYEQAPYKSKFTYNGKAYGQIKSNDAVQIVPCHQQQITNSCGLHTGMNLYAMNENPNITDTSQFGKALEEELGKDKKQDVALDFLAQLIRGAIKKAPQPATQL